MTTDKVWLVTGTRRGIGFALVSQLLEKPNNVVYASVRDVSKAGAELQGLAKSHKNLHIVKLESGSVEDAKDVAAHIEAVSHSNMIQCVGHLTIAQTSGGLDYLIANVGGSDAKKTVDEITVEDLNADLKTNAIGAFVLWQAVHKLLLKRSTRVFLAVTSIAGSITNVPQNGNWPLSSYAVAKAALNMLVARISAEKQGDNLIAFVVHPGIVTTEKSNELLVRLCI